ncbi:MAG: DNA polymerase I [Chlamydiales bacterium]|nr:DNA polymerase I [Chlamydiia bacterium]MCP5507764.1 DNA polymerase I [Chlamydiales bacterium]
MKKIFILDASGYLYRSYFAIRGMTNPAGESTNALYGFIRSLLKLIKDFEPTHFVAVFDGPDNIKKRKALYPEYKAHRTKMPPDLRYQIDWAQEFCKLMGLPLLSIPEVEADDTMGTVAKWAEQQGAEAFLCTSDKDMAQLVDDKIKILNTHKDNLILGAKEVKETYGVPPNKIIDLLAITGDSSDNVPGLSGIGPKTAVKLLEEFGDLNTLLDNPEKVSGKKQETILREAENARLSKQLVTIDTAVEVPHEADFFKIRSHDRDALKGFYMKMNFKTLVQELEKMEGGEEEAVTYVLVDDENAFKDLLALLAKEKEICFDTETTNQRPLQAELVGIGFGIEPKKAWYVPANGNLGLERVLEGVKPIFENKNIGFYGHNVKYDYHILGNYNITVANVCFDTILASYVLNANQRQHSLDTLSLENFGKVKIPTGELIGKGKNQITMREVPIEKVSYYCCEDVDYTCRLKILFSKQLKERKLEKLYNTLELPLLKILAEMERHGIFLDVPYLDTLGKSLAEEISKLEKTIYAEAGEEFNLNSPKQLGQILFDKLGINPPKKTATGFSTSADVLESLKHQHPICEQVMQYRMLEKLRSTYVETLPHEVNPKSHRVHCTFNQFVTATGRLSCQDPNLQNIPARTEIGREIRAAFKPEKNGWSYLSADYSQIELRILAHLSGDPTLVKAFADGEDIHAHTAATLFGVAPDQINKELRTRAKAVNFGIIYGQGPFGLSQSLGISVKEAKDFIQMYFDRFSHVKEYLETCKEYAREHGKAVTITGRERAIPEIKSQNQQIRASAERLAINTPFQGTAADLIKMAMITIDTLLKKEQKLGYMILQIHDELIFELPDFEIPLIEPLVRDNMQNVLELKVPLEVNISIGKNWKEC